MPKRIDISTLPPAIAEKVKKRQARKDRYYLKHRESILLKQADYRQANEDELNEKALQGCYDRVKPKRQKSASEKSSR